MRKPVDFKYATPQARRTRWENVIRVLRALTPHERRKHFDMSVWGMKNDCGTVACAAGHCGLDPWFRRRGIKLDFIRESSGGYYSRFSHSTVIPFFGETGYHRIFVGRFTTVPEVIKAIRHMLKTDSDFAGN